MMKKLKIPYFPPGFVFLALIPLILGFYFLSHYLKTGVIMFSLAMLIAILAMTTFYITEVNLKEAAYKDYISIFGLVLNYKKVQLNKIDKIIITLGRHEHTARRLRAQPYLVTWHEFTAFLIHDNVELELMTKKDKKKLIEEVKGIADFFKVDIEDRSVRDPYVVDLKKI